MIALIMAMAGEASLPKFLKSAVSPDDYPQSSLSRNEEGFEIINLLVSPTGSVEKCDMVIPSKYRNLDIAACASMMKAKLSPANDQNGVAVYGRIKTWVAWSIDRRAKLSPIADVGLTINHIPEGLSAVPISKLALVVDSLGNVEKCEVAATSGSPVLDRVACSAGVAGAQVQVTKNVSGVAVRSVISLNVAFATENPPKKQK